MADHTIRKLCVPALGAAGSCIRHSDARQLSAESSRSRFGAGQAAHQRHADDIDRQVRLYGPGDVTGIDPQQVVRTEPRHLATDFEPNYFPAIEFDRPDFPWLFTPAKADADGKLRPWLCLVVVRKQEGVTLRVDRNLPLPVLEIKAPARPERELPDLSESWAWAHAQVAGSRAGRRFAETIVGGRPGADGVAVVVSAPARSADRLSGLRRAGVRAGTQSGTWFADSARRRTTQLEPAWASGRNLLTQVTLAGLLSLGVSHRRRAAISKRWCDCSKRAIGLPTKSASGRWTSVSPDSDDHAAASGHDARA